MYVSRNNYAGDSSYVVTLNFPHKVTTQTQSGATGTVWRDPNYPYLLVNKPEEFELSEGISLAPGEGPIRYLLSRVEEVGQEVVSYKEGENND